MSSSHLQALKHCGGVDFLVCTAGVNPLVGSTLGSSEQIWDKVRTGNDGRKVVRLHPLLLRNSPVLLTYPELVFNSHILTPPVHHRLISTEKVHMLYEPQLPSVKCREGYLKCGSHLPCPGVPSLQVIPNMRKTSGAQKRRQFSSLSASLGRASCLHAQLPCFLIQ